VKSEDFEYSLMRAESQCQIRLEKMTTRGEYRKQWNSYLNNLSTQISDFEWFESEVRSGQRPHVSVRLQDCEEDSLYLSITRHERTSGRAYIFRLESCPFCAYQLFTIELSPSKELMARGLWHLLSLIADMQPSVCDRRHRADQIRSSPRSRANSSRSARSRRS
jgi:hypothetical protein